MDDSYTPEKWIWTDADFDSMSWHDCKIHGWGLVYEMEDFSSEVVLDLDYLLQWICPAPTSEDRGVWFWIAPATLVFEDIEAVDFDFGLKGMISLEINHFHREITQDKLRPESQKWVLDCFGGNIEIVASRFKMYLRATPVLQQQQHLALKDRGGISFARVTPEMD